VAATGFPTKPSSISDGFKHYHFYAEDVHDFAWAASPDFIYMEEPFSTDHIPGVQIKLYLDPAHRELKQRYMTAAKKSLAAYSEWFGPYPYSTLSIVVPPPGGNGAGGMEYPTLITAWDASEAIPGYELERVVVHEIGHQFWYGLVASNEFEEAWLDEGFTSYAEDLVMAHIYDVQPNHLIEAALMTDPASLNTYSWLFRDHTHYAENVYTRAKLVLLGIERTIGQAQMKKVLQVYYQRWVFKHPSAQDFKAVLEEVTARDWSSYFEQFIEGGQMTDYAIKRIQVQTHEVQGQTEYISKVLVSKKDGFHLEVPIRFQFTDGTFVDQLWPGQEDQVQFTLRHTAPVEWAVIDPAFTLVLENNHLNNFLRTETDPNWKIRLKLGIYNLIEILLSGIV
jgi:aminopeptidase N